MVNILLNGLGKELPVTKVTSVSLRRPETKQFIYFDELEDGTWRIVHTDKVIPDISLLQSIGIIRNQTKEQE